MSVQALVQAPVTYNGPEIQKETLSSSQSLANSATTLAKEALGKSASKQDSCVTDLLNCSRVWKPTENSKSSEIQNPEKKANLEKKRKELNLIIDNLQKTLNNPNLTQSELVNNTESFEKELKKLNDLKTKNMLRGEKVQLLFKNFAKQVATLEEIQKKIRSCSFDKKPGLERELLIHKTLLKVINSAHIDVEREVASFINIGPEHRANKQEECTTLVRDNSANALTKYKLELHNKIHLKRLNTIPEGKAFVEELEKVMLPLQTFQKEEANTETGFDTYLYVKKNKQQDLKKLTRTAQENFFNYTKEIVAYKKNVQADLKNFNLVERDERFQTEIAYGYEEQAKINRENFKEAKVEAEAMKKDVLTQIDNVWKKICQNHSKLHTKLTQCELAIGQVNEKQKSMYFYSETRVEGLTKATGHKNLAFELNTDLNAEEKIPDSYSFLSLEEAVAADEEAVADQATEAVETTLVEEKQEENVNEAAVASQIDATEAAAAKAVDEDNEIIDLEFISKA